MLGPLFQVQGVLYPAAGKLRVVSEWRPTIAPIVAGTGQPDPTLPPLGIAFVNGPGEVRVGTHFSGSFRLLAWPDPRCGRIALGVELVFLEGVTVVGSGKIIAIDHGHGA